MSDDPGMTTDTTSYETTNTPRRRLVRPVSGRAVTGVAAGLADYLKLSVGVIRVAFLLLVIAGGLGLALYVAGWLLIPDESESESIAQRVFDNVSSRSSWLGIALLVIAAVIILDAFTFMPGSLIWAGVLVTVGLLLYRGDIGPREETATPTAGRREPPEATDTAEPPPSGGTDLPPRPPAGSRPEPPPAPAAPPPPPTPPSILGRVTVAAALLAVGVLAVVDNITALVEPAPRHYVALATVVVGLGLLAGAWAGRARWMILLGIFLVPALLASPVAEVNWEGEMRRVVTPIELDELQGQYRTTAGSYVFDLRGSEWDGSEVALEVDIAAGEILVAVPDDVAVIGTAGVAVGVIETPQGEHSGIGNLERSIDLAGDRGTLEVDLDVGAGVVRIHRGDSPPDLSGAASRGAFFDRHTTERNR